MARWKSGGWKNYLNVKLKWLRKWDEYPYFEVSRWWNKQAKKPEEILSDPDCTFIEWKLIRVETEQYEYEWRTMHSIELYLSDSDNNVLCFQSSYTWIMKMWLLKLASADHLWLLRFSVYAKDWKKRGWVTNDGEGMESKFDWEKEIKPLTEWYPNWTSDDTKLIEFLESDSVLWKIREKLPKMEPTTEESSDPIEEEKEEDLPF